MVELEWKLRRERGVTLVEGWVRNQDATAVRVRVANQLSELWPPRSEGLPEAGWDDGGWEGLVPSESRVVFGYASPADPVEPPVAVAWSERAESPETELDSPAAVVQALGDASPPRDAVPVGEQPTNARTTTAQPELPPSVLDWLESVERDVVTAERLAAVETVAEAARAVEAHGGLEGVRQFAGDVEQTADLLESLRADLARFEERIDEATIPTNTLAELA